MPIGLRSTSTSGGPPGRRLVTLRHEHL